MRYFAGLDVSLNETALCVVDEVGTIIREGKAGSEPAALIVWLAELDPGRRRRELTGPATRVPPSRRSDVPPRDAVGATAD